jgi:hypothetical protein
VRIGQVWSTPRAWQTGWRPPDAAWAAARGSNGQETRGAPPALLSDTTALTSRRSTSTAARPARRPATVLAPGAHAALRHLGGGRVGHDAELIGALAEQDAVDLVAAEVDTAGVHFRKDELDGILLPDDYLAPAGNHSAPAGNASIEGYEHGGYQYSR